MEYKTLNLDLSVKADECGTIEAYGSVFGVVDAYGDRTLKGCFLESIAKQLPKMLLNHKMDGLPIGVWTSAEEDEKGLRLVGSLTPGSTLSSDVRASLLQKALSGVSIGYRTLDAAPNDFGGMDLKRIDLVEVSLVNSPANHECSVTSVKQADTSKQLAMIEARLDRMLTK